MRRTTFGPLLAACLLLPACGSDASGPQASVVSEIALQWPGSRLLVSEEFTIVAEPRDAGGAPVADAPLSWTSYAPDVVAVDGGVVRGLALGTATIEVASGDARASVQLRVVARPVSCAEEGTVASSVADSTMWRAADGPHHVRSLVLVQDALVIQPGTLVCGAEGGSLQLGSALVQAGSLTALGTAQDSIRFLAADPARPWGGVNIVAASGIDMAFVRFENAVEGLAGYESAVTNVRDAVFRQIGGQAISGRSGVVERVRIDTVATGLNFVGAGSTFQIRDVTVRHATDTGILLQRAAAEMHDVRVLDAGRIGVWFLHAGARLAAGSGIVVDGSGETGILVDAGGFTLTGCSVTNSAGHGVLVAGSAIAIHQCNFQGNGGAGVSTSSVLPVDASGNWWGDPAGPAGPNGDGVEGPVTTAPHLTSPVG